MWTGLTESPGVTVEPGTGRSVCPVCSLYPVYPVCSVEPSTRYRAPVPGPGVTGHVQSTLVGRPDTAEPTLSKLTGRNDRCHKKRVVPPGILIQTKGIYPVDSVPKEESPSGGF